MFAELWIDISTLVGSADMNDIAAAAANLQDYDGLMTVAIALLVSILAVAGIAVSKKYSYDPQWLSRITAALKAIFADKNVKEVTGIDSLDSAIAAAGYSYDPKQDIFYSSMDAWQRNVGYCRLYDEAATPMGMIIDCEPVYFEYDSRRWLIEFWKGQYDLTTGCEIGVYSTDKPDINIPGVFNGPFYDCASNEDLLQMSYSLRRNGRTLFTREGKHWWLTGFVLGEFSEPTELSMYLNITLKDKAMLEAFLKGLKEAGYSEREIIINQNTVRLKFDEARTPQPYTRTPQTDWVIQKKNKALCDKYQDITGPYDTFPDKIKAIQEQAPELLEEIINIGKTRQLFKNFNVIKEYLN